MPLTAYPPAGDPSNKHLRHQNSRPFSPGLPEGNYVYVQDVCGVVRVLRFDDQPGHAHHVVLGRGRPAASAGELVLGPRGRVIEINNCSGTFCCAADSLLVAIGGLFRQGAVVDADTRIQEFEA